MQKGAAVRLRLFLFFAGICPRDWSFFIFMGMSPRDWSFFDICGNVSDRIFL